MTADSPIPVVSAKDTAAVLDAVDRTGVVVLDGLFDLDFVRAVKAEYLDYHEKVRLFLDRVLPPSKTCLYGNLSIRIPTRWEHLFDLLPYYKPPTLSEASNFLPPALDAAVRKVLRISEDDGFYMELGGIPSGAHAAAGSWHRDSFPIFDEKTDANLPPWYLTMVIPLIEDEENGAADGADGGAAFGTTSFIVGSHRKTLEELERTPWNPEEYVSAGARVKLGQAVLFDGRTVHRGEANNTDKMRPFLYMVFNRSWYIDRELAYLPNLYDDGTIPEKRDAPVKPEDAAPHKQILTERTWPAVSR